MHWHSVHVSISPCSLETFFPFGVGPNLHTESIATVGTPLAEGLPQEANAIGDRRKSTETLTIGYCAQLEYIYRQNVNQPIK